MEAFCNSFEEAPSHCAKLELFSQYNNFSSFGLVKFVAISVGITLAIVALFILVFSFLYRKKINSAFKVELNKKVDEYLNKYYKNEHDGAYSGIAKQDAH